MVIDIGTFLALFGSAGENILQLCKRTFESFRGYMPKLTSIRSEDNCGKTNGVRNRLTLVLGVVGVVEGKPFSVMR